MLVRHRKLRPWRALAYALLAAGGIVIWVDPTRQMEGIPFLVRWVWTGFIVAGSLVSMVGPLTDKWLYEFAGLPLVMTGFTGLVIVLAAGDGNTARYAFSCWLANIVVQKLRRWGSLLKFVLAVRRAQRAIQERENGGRDA